jgi:hypothetical protein
MVPPPRPWTAQDDNCLRIAWNDYVFVGHVVLNAHRLLPTRTEDEIRARMIWLMDFSPSSD